MVAMVGVLLIHVPPPGSVSVMVALTHTADGPLIADGNGLTVTVVVRMQPVAAA